MIKLIAGKAAAYNRVNWRIKGSRRHFWCCLGGKCSRYPLVSDTWKLGELEVPALLCIGELGYYIDKLAGQCKAE